LRKDSALTPVTSEKSTLFIELTKLSGFAKISYALWFASRYFIFLKGILFNSASHSEKALKPHNIY